MAEEGGQEIQSNKENATDASKRVLADMSSRALYRVTTFTGLSSISTGGVAYELFAAGHTYLGILDTAASLILSAIAIGSFRESDRRGQ